MKTRLLKPLLWINVLSLALPAVSAADPAVGGKEGHSGHYIEVNGRPELLELAKDMSCDWKFGRDFTDKLTYWPKLIEKLGKVHWYFAENLNREVETVRVCVTGATLPQLPVSDLDGLTVVDEQSVVEYGSIYDIEAPLRNKEKPKKPADGIRRAKQIAIRFNDEIHIDNKAFKRMSAKTKAYVWLHELMHQYMFRNKSDLGPTRYNEKVRDMVAAIRRNNEFTPYDESGFGLQILQNEVKIHENTRIFRRIKDELRLLLGTYDGLQLDDVFGALKGIWDKNEVFYFTFERLRPHDQQKLKIVQMMLNDQFRYAVEAGAEGLSDAQKYADLGAVIQWDLSRESGPWVPPYESGKIAKRLIEEGRRDVIASLLKTPKWRSLLSIPQATVEFAIAAGQPEIARLLMDAEQMASGNSFNKVNLLRAAILKKDLVTAQRLIKDVVPELNNTMALMRPDKRYECKATPLYLAVLMKDLRMVNLILGQQGQQGLDLNLDSEGDCYEYKQSPFNLAVILNEKAIARRLLDFGGTEIDGTEGLCVLLKGGEKALSLQVAKNAALGVERINGILNTGTMIHRSACMEHRGTLGLVGVYRGWSLVGLAISRGYVDILRALANRNLVFPRADFAYHMSSWTTAGSGAKAWPEETLNPIDFAERIKRDDIAEFLEKIR